MFSISPTQIESSRKILRGFNNSIRKLIARPSSRETWIYQRKTRKKLLLILYLLAVQYPADEIMIQRALLHQVRFFSAQVLR